MMLQVEQLKTFIECPKKRQRSACPNIGDLVPLLLIQKEVTFADLSLVLVPENVRRSARFTDVLSSKAYPSYESLFAAWSDDHPATLRVTLFHKLFYDTIVRPCPSIEAVKVWYDNTWSQLSRPCLAALKEGYHTIMRASCIQNKIAALLCNERYGLDCMQISVGWNCNCAGCMIDF